MHLFPRIPLCLQILLLLIVACKAGHFDDDDVLNDDDILDGRIVGGEDAEPGEFPFFVKWRGCGASLIWKDILLTAAHVRPKHILF